MKRKILFLCFFFLFIIEAKAYSFNDIPDSNTRALLEELSQNWPSNMDESRVAVIKKAASLIGTGVTYGSFTGTYENPIKMDCSDYVAWAFAKAGVSDVGYDWYTGTFVSSGVFESITEGSLIPGDVGLNNSSDSQYNHIGLYVGQKDGQNIWFHSSTVNGVSGPQVRYGNGYFTVYYRYRNWNEVHLSASSGSQNAGGDATLGSTSDSYENFPLIDESSDFTCETIFYSMNNGQKEPKTLKVIMDWVFNIIKFATPLLTISFTTADYVKLITKGAFDDLQKTNLKTLKRIVIMLLILMLPYLLEIIFESFGLYDLSNCGIS